MLEQSLSEQVTRKFIESTPISDWEVLTEDGYVDIKNLHTTIEYEVWEIVLENGASLKCADTHIIIDETYQEVFAYQSLGKNIRTKFGVSKVISVQNLGYSENMYDLEIDSDKHTYYTSDILSHNTTSLIASMLHYVIFNNEKTVALLANKGDTAREILGRVQLAYENLPYWMQQGVDVFNKGRMELENNSRIIATATSGSAIRGYAISMAFIDECIGGKTLLTVMDTETNQISHIQVQDLYNDCIINTKYKVLTENGFQDFSGIKKQEVDNTLVISFDDSSILECTLSHQIKLNSGLFEYGFNLVVGDKTSTGKTITSIIEQDIPKDVYDLLDVSGGSHYLTNSVTSHNCAFIENWDEFYTSVYPTISSGKDTKVVLVSTPKGLNFYYKLWTDAVNGDNEFIPIKVTWEDVPGRDLAWKEQTIANTSMEAFIQEHEAEFVGSSGTLIEGWKLKELVVKDPIQATKYSKIYEAPQKGEEYVVCCDVSRGRGIDNSAFCVIKISSLPYKIVATYYCDNISPDMYAEVIHQAYLKYNKAYVLVENNDAGCETLRVLNDTYECETIMGTIHGTVAGDKKRISINGHGGEFELGIRTTKSTKAIGCSRLKTLIENNTLEVGDKIAIEELNRFSRKGTSYEAEQGAHDDIVMTLVAFSWLTTQDLFEGLTSINVRGEIRAKMKSKLEDDLVPFGYIIDGLDNTFEDADMTRNLLGYSVALPEYEDYWEAVGYTDSESTLFGLP